METISLHTLPSIASEFNRDLSWLRKKVKELNIKVVGVVANDRHTTAITSQDLKKLLDNVSVLKAPKATKQDMRATEAANKLKMDFSNFRRFCVRNAVKLVAKDIKGRCVKCISKEDFIRLKTIRKEI
jgi:gamma-glutamylcysteine synthetase